MYISIAFFLFQLRPPRAMEHLKKVSCVYGQYNLKIYHFINDQVLIIDKTHCIIAIHCTSLTLVSFPFCHLSTSAFGGGGGLVKENFTANIIFQ